MSATGKKTTTWSWDPKKRLAAKHVAENRLTRERIAETVGIDKKTLYRWLNQDAFREYVGRLREEIDATMRQGLFGQKSDRVNWLKQEAQVLAEAVERRRSDAIAAGEQDPDVRTGHFVREEKSVGYGPSTRVVTTVVETPTVRRIQSLFDQIAKEQGDYVLRTDATLQVTSEEVTIREVVVDQSAGTALDEDDDEDDADD